MKRQFFMFSMALMLCLGNSAFAGKGGGKGGSGGETEPAVSYDVVALDDDEGRYTDAWARDVNDLGSVVGSAEDSGSVWIAASWSTAYADGQMTTQLNILDGGTGGMAYGINNHGQIVGVGLDSAGNDVGLYWPSADELPLTLSPLQGHSVSWAKSINEEGVICGNSSAQPVVWRAGIDDKGKPKILGPFTLPTLGPDGVTSAINTRGDGYADVVGHLVFRDEDGNDIDHAAARWSLEILPDGTVAADDPVILDVQAEAYGANNNGAICGVSSYPSEATVWSGSETTLLPWGKDVLAATAYDIGNHGTVVGKAAFLLRRYPAGVDRAVVWPSGSQEMVNLNSFLPNRSPLVSLQTAEAVNMHGEIVGDAGVGAFVAVPR